MLPTDVRCIARLRESLSWRAGRNREESLRNAEGVLLGARSRIMQVPVDQAQLDDLDFHFPGYHVEGVRAELLVHMDVVDQAVLSAIQECDSFTLAGRDGHVYEVVVLGGVAAHSLIRLVEVGVMSDRVAG